MSLYLLDPAHNHSFSGYSRTDVAVTGIPEPQVRHASILVRFAKDCLEVLPVVTRRLADALGSDTMDLSMRVGIHSGSATAGVLRGDKGRFQVVGILHQAHNVCLDKLSKTQLWLSLSLSLLALW